MKLKSFLLFILLLSLGHFSNGAVLPIHLKEHADTMPKENRLSNIRISNYLAEATKNDTEKVLIFSYWIAKNMKYEKKHVKQLGYNQTPQELLLNKKGVCGCFANLFQKFCENTGVKSYKVSGKINTNILNKVFFYKFKLKHAWNVVYINGDWKLVDVTWVQSDLKNKDFKHTLNMKWIFMSPEEFIKTHFPYFPNWQLLDHPYSKQDIKMKRKPEDIDSPLLFSNDTILLGNSPIESEIYLNNIRFKDRLNSKRYYKSMVHIGWKAVFWTNDSTEIKNGLKLLKALNTQIERKRFFLKKRSYLRYISTALCFGEKQLKKEKFLPLR